MKYVSRDCLARFILNYGKDDYFPKNDLKDVG